MGDTYFANVRGLDYKSKSDAIAGGLAAAAAMAEQNPTIRIAVSAGKTSALGENQKTPIEQNK